MKPSILMMVELTKDIWESVPSERPFAALATDAVGNERRIQKAVGVGRERARYVQLCNWIEMSALSAQHNGLASASVIWTDSHSEQPVLEYLRLIQVLDAHPDLYGVLNTPQRIVVSPEPPPLSVVPVPSASTYPRRRSFWVWLATLLRLEYEESAERVERPAQLVPPLTVVRAAPPPEESLAPRSLRAGPLGKSFFRPGDEVLEQGEIFGRLTSDRIELLGSAVPPNRLRVVERLAREKSAFFFKAHQRGSAVVEIIASSPIASPIEGAVTA